MKKLFIGLLIICMAVFIVSCAPVALGQVGALGLSPVTNIDLSIGFLAGAAGAVLSLFFNFFPKVNTWYAGMTEQFKKLLMVGLLAGLMAAFIGLMCLNVITITGLICSKNELVTFAYTLFWAILGNQGIFQITPQTTAVKIAGMESDRKALLALKKEAAK